MVDAGRCAGEPEFVRLPWSGGGPDNWTGVGHWPTIDYMSYRLRLVPLLALVTCAASPAAKAPPRPRLPLVVLDPGHGGGNYGAAGPAIEKEVTLALARRAAELLERTTGTRVALTREWDHHVGLAERAEIANRLGADALLSLHCNSSPTPGPTGFEAFYLSTPGAAQPRHLRAVRARAPEGVSEHVRSILADLASGGSRLGGAHLADAVREQLARAVPGPDRGVKPAAYTVLVSASVPAAVLEVGFLNHPEEGRALADPAYQERVATGVARGVADFLRRSGRLD